MIKKLKDREHVYKKNIRIEEAGKKNTLCTDIQEHYHADGGWGGEQINTNLPKRFQMFENNTQHKSSLISTAVK